MGTELFSPEVVNTVVDTGKTLISSPAVQLYAGERILKVWRR